MPTSCLAVTLQENRAKGQSSQQGLGAAQCVKLENKVKAAEWEPGEQWVGELESREPTQHRGERMCWVMGELIKNNESFGTEFGVLFLLNSLSWRPIQALSKHIIS